MATLDVTSRCRRCNMVSAPLPSVRQKTSGNYNPNPWHGHCLAAPSQPPGPHFGPPQVKTKSAPFLYSPFGPLFEGLLLRSACPGGVALPFWLKATWTSRLFSNSSPPRPIKGSFDLFENLFLGFPLGRAVLCCCRGTGGLATWWW